MDQRFRQERFRARVIAWIGWAWVLLGVLAWRSYGSTVGTVLFALAFISLLTSIARERQAVRALARRRSDTGDGPPA